MSQLRSATLHHQSGQVLIEAILILAIFMGLARMITLFLQTHQVAQKLVEGPWANVAGMIECGVWTPAPCAVDMHPQTKARVLSLRPDPAAGQP